MKLVTATTGQKTAEFVKLGYDVSLTFRAPMSDWETLEASLRAVDSYNKFDAETVLASFRSHFDNAMGVEFGRESSPVMYVSLPFWSHQRNGSESSGMGEHYTDEERQEMARSLIVWARSVHADEISVAQVGVGGDVWDAAGEKPHRVRIWWD